MHVVNLQVVASLRIKRKKPWKRLAWIGKLKESVLLLEDHRVSVLFVPSGNTKRKITKLSPILKDCVSLNYTQDGCFVFGLLQNGTIFTWNKDTNFVTHISSIPDLQSRSIPNLKWRPFVYMDDGGDHVVSIVLTPTATTEIFVWKKSCSFTEIPNRWWRIDGSDVDSRCSKELSLDVCFAIDESLGHAARCAFVFTRGLFVCFLALNVNWPTLQLAPIVHRWSSVTFPFDRISSTARPSKRKGSYVVRWSRDTSVAAVVVNQDDAEDGRIFFVSVNCQVLVVSRVHVDGFERHDDKKCLHWICDAAWTNNDLFLVTVNRLGSVCLVSRLGEPLVIGTHGCSMDLSPSRSLNIHPFVFVRNSTMKNDEDSIATTSGNILKQRFSVSCHPRLPVFLCSDGYLVTCLQLPTLLTDPHRAVYVFLRESQKSLKQLKKLIQQQKGGLIATSRETPLTTLKSENTFRRSFGLKEPQLVRWEEPHTEDMDSSADSSVRYIHRFSAIGKENQGVLSFGTFDSIIGPNLSNDSTDVALSDAISDAQKETLASLFCAWSIVVSTKDTWTIEWETRAKSVTELLIKLCSMYSKQIISYNAMNRTESICSPVDEIVAIMDRFLLFCRFDGLRKNTMPVVIGVVRTVFGRKLLSALRELPPEIGSRCLDAVAMLLSSVSDAIVSTFSWCPNKLILYKVGQSAFEDVYSPTSTGQSMRNTYGSGQQQALGGRLISIWRRLYSLAKSIYRNLDSTCKMAPILGRIQAQIQLLGLSLEKTRKIKITAEQRNHLLNPNERDAIINKWWQDAEKMIPDRNATRKTTKLLHSILYSYLENYRLEEAVNLIHKLIAFEKNTGLRHRAVRTVVRSLARFMSFYFVGSPLVVHPWHHPRPLPCANDREKRTDRYIALDRDYVVLCLRNKYVSEQWSADVSMALLLSTGCLNEAADLARYLGDWKSSFVVSVAVSIVLNRPTSKVCFELFQSHVCQLLGLGKEKGSDSSVSDVSLPNNLEECLVTGVLCGLNIVPSICECLLKELRILVRKLDSVLVPEEIYVPRPPIYCPQLKDPVAEEDYVVARIASVLRLVRILLCASHCHVHVVHEYLSQLSRISRMKSFDTESTKMPANFMLGEMLQRLEDQIQNSNRPENVSRIDLKTMVQCFRDICSVSWFMNVRDKTSRYFRKFRESVEAEKIVKSKIMSKNCSQVLQWAFHLFPFVEFMDWNLEVYNLMLSVLLEMPADEKASAVLAKLFPDMTQIPDELNYRINRLLSVWRSSTVEVKDNSRRHRDNSGSGRTKRTMGLTKTLSVIHLEQCQQMKNDAIHLDVAVGPLEKNVLVDEERPSTIERVRPYEMDKDYHEFLELMFDVGFLKDSISTSEVPLFTSNLKRIGKQHLSKVRLNSKNLTIDEFLIVPRVEFPRVSTSTPKKSSGSGLFRSFSLSDLHMKTTKAGMPSSPSRTLNTISTVRGNLIKGKSLTNLYKKDKKEKKETLVSTPFRNQSEPVRNILALCESYSYDQNVTIDCDRKENLLKLLTYLVRWAERDDRTKSKRFKSPRVKVHLSAAQLLSPLWTYAESDSIFKQVDGFSTGNLDSSGSNWSPTVVTPRDFLTSTPVRTSVDSVSDSVTLRSNSGRHSRANRSLSQNLRSIPKIYDTGDDLISEYFKRLKLYQHEYDDSSTFDSSTFEISSLPSDYNKSSYDSVKSVSGKSPECDDPSLVTFTSRWTNSNRTESKARLVSDRNLRKPTFVDQLDIPRAKDTKIEISTKKSDLVSCAVQVHETSLLEDKSSIHPDRSDDTLNEISSPENTSNSSKDVKNQSRLVRRDAVKRVRRISDVKSKEDGERTDPELEFYRVPLLKLPAEKELCLLDVGTALNLYPRTRKNIASAVNLSSGQPMMIPPLLYLEKSHEETVLSMKLLSEDELLKYEEKALKRSKSSRSLKPPVPPKPLKLQVEHNHSDEKIISVEKRKQQSRVDVGVGSSSFSGYFKSVPIKVRDVQTNTEDPIGDVRVIKKDADMQDYRADSENHIAIQDSRVITKEVHQKNQLCDVSTSTENKLQKSDPIAVSSAETVPVKESRSVGVETTNGLVAKEDKATSPIVSEDQQHQTNGKVLYKSELSNHRKTQTETDGLTKKSFVTTDSQTDTETKVIESRFYKKPDKVATALVETTKTVDLNLDDFVFTRSTDLTLNDSVWKSQLDGAGRNVYQKLQSLDSEAKTIKSELTDTKKFLERLELLEEEGLLSKQFPSDIEMQDATETTEQQRNGRNELNVKDDIVSIQTSNCSNNVETIGNRQKQHDVVKSELKSWMRRKSSERQKSFRESMDKFRALERVPFVTTGQPVTNKMILKSKEERIERNKEMSATHFQARKDEALRLLRDLVQDKVPSSTVSRPITRNISARSKSFRTEATNDVINRTYILDRGLIPVKSFRDETIKISSKLDSHQSTSCTTERLKYLRETRKEPMTLTRFQERALSRSSSCDTISSWSIPEDVRQILYGNGSNHIQD